MPRCSFLLPPPAALPPAAEGKQSPLADEDKAAVREVMLEGVTRAPHAVRVQVSWELPAWFVNCVYKLQSRLALQRRRLRMCRLWPGGLSGSCCMVAGSALLELAGRLLGHVLLLLRCWSE